MEISPGSAAPRISTGFSTLTPDDAMSAFATTTFKHSTGTLKGLQLQENVVQYRCIPYASIPARFKHSKLIDLGNFDATKLGDSCASFAID
jgi:hypothetical protein